MGRTAFIRVALPLAALCFACPVRAEGPALAPESAARATAEQARALFKEGRKLTAEGNHAAACAKFEESLALVDGIGTRFNLASCHESLGRFASARSGFLQTAEAAKLAGQPEREKLSRERAAALDGRLAKLEIAVPDPVTGLEIRRNDELVTPSEWNAATPVDAGSFTIEASAPGKRRWSSPVTVPNSSLVVVTVPKLEALPPPPPAPVESSEPAPSDRAAEPDTAPEPNPAANRDSDARKGIRTASYVVGGVGLAGLVVGTTFALQYQTSYNDSKAVCRGSVNCTPEEVALHRSLVDDSKQAATFAYVGFGVGAVALIGATLLFVSSTGERSTSEAPAAASLEAAPSLGADGTFGALVTGSF